MPPAKRGVFISFEGIEGAGKSTHARMLSEHLRSKGYSIVTTREPGGTRISHKIREMLLSIENKGIDPVTELLLYEAARRQHLKEVILPALEDGKVVITDRFSDSTLAYQGAGRGIEPEVIKGLDKIATGGLKPDITLLLDVIPEAGLGRNRKAGKMDRIELERIDFHRRVREGFLSIQSAESERVVLIDSEKGLKEVHDEIVSKVEALLEK